MLGWTEAELVGKGHDVILGMLDSVQLRYLYELASSGTVVAKLTYRRKDGTTFLGEISLTSYINKNGEPQVCEIIRDVTEREHDTEALNDAYEKLQAQSEELQSYNEELHAHSEELQYKMNSCRLKPKRYR